MDKKAKYLIYSTAPHKKEIERLMVKVKQKILTLVPLRLYFNDRGRVKVELALGAGKKTYDRRGIPLCQDSCHSCYRRLL